MTRFLRASTLWLWGGFLYCLIELLWRGYTHPAMYAVGGVCFWLVGGLNNYLPWDMGFLPQSIIGAAVVTAAELLSGYILNLRLGLGIWDYSALPFNLWGQICLAYSLWWVLLSGVGIVVDDYLRWMLFGERRPRYTIL